MSTEKSVSQETEEAGIGEGVPRDGPPAEGPDRKTQKTKPNIEKETGDTQPKDDSLSAFLLMMRLDSQTLSGLARERESFGLAWLGLRLLKRTLRKNPVTSPRSIDLSGARGLSPEKIFLFLDSLPASVEEMKLDSAAVKRRGLPLFVSFLERLSSAREGGQEAPCLKSFTFAEGSIGPEGAAKIFLLLLSSLETLCLKGNRLGPKGIRAVAEGVREEKAASLRVLDLERTGLEKEGLKSLCEVMNRKSLKVETLNLSGNAIGGKEEMEGLRSVLCKYSLPSIRELFLRECGLTDGGARCVLQAMEVDDLPELEVFDVGENRLTPFGLKHIGFALRLGGVPRLRDLNLSEACFSGDGVGEFLRALSHPNCPRDLVVRGVRLASEDLDEEEVHALGAGKCPSLRSLDLSLSADLSADDHVTAFLEQMANEEGGGKFEVLDLRLELSGENRNESLTSLGVVIGKGSFACLGKLDVWRSMNGYEDEDGNFIDDDDDDDMDMTEGRSAFFTSLSRAFLPRLSELHVYDLLLTDADMTLFAEAVRVGNLPGLRVLVLGGERVDGGVGRVGMEALMGAVVESRDGLPFLETIDFYGTRAGEGAGSLGTSLLSGKLARLSSICLMNSHLTDAALREIAHAVKEGGLVGITVLDLRGTEIEGQTWGEFMRAIAESEGGMSKLNLFPPRLRSEITFKVSQVNVNVDSLIRAIGESEGGLPSCVKNLVLSGGRFSEEALVSLATSGGGESGGKLSHLTSLDLSSCGIDDAGLRRLGEVFSAYECRSLLTIVLYKNEISLEGLQAFLGALTPQSLPALRFLHLDGQTGVGGEEEQEKFASSVRSLREAAHSAGKLLGWKGHFAG
uniref:Uncharacterized protein n=1 Tax=Chromera velia CCMP2878 TaxID=1169474 RepID=A0A0G4FT73_9ALVE|eukprot:Cvel_18555.t1-p1 / transcript=Cvel_18555.t1 / gene=Cvel_18555 / organism=Chromera_velia_CCMP2878 / gene_product=hypothetical protein / transcript_product=hypothetical protein / location=Cvel_scaffold1545:34062-39002(-) / protein_length=852 / sequence_SO=supercontig / SO=protein_coding / is_pseudo=false